MYKCMTILGLKSLPDITNFIRTYVRFWVLRHHAIMLSCYYVVFSLSLVLYIGVILIPQ